METAADSFQRVLVSWPELSLEKFQNVSRPKSKRADVCQSVMLVTDSKTARLRPEQFFRICGQPRTPRLIVPNREKEPKARSLVLQISKKQNFIIPEFTYQLTNYLNKIKCTDSKTVTCHMTPFLLWLWAAIRAAPTWAWRGLSLHLETPNQIRVSRRPCFETTETFGHARQGLSATPPDSCKM